MAFVCSYSFPIFLEIVHSPRIGPPGINVEAADLGFERLVEQFLQLNWPLQRSLRGTIKYYGVPT